MLQGLIFFSANMDKRELADLCEIIGYKTGQLPLRYLGVSISAKKLSVMDCEVLIDKLTSRIKLWGSKHLSYAGRTQLINSVLMHIHAYRSYIFIIPKTVMKQIITLCRSFSWTRQIHLLSCL